MSFQHEEYADEDPSIKKYFQIHQLNPVLLMLLNKKQK